MDKKPSETEVLEAVRKLILWAGDDPEREGLIETPKRVAKAYKEFFSGYHDDPFEILNKTFEEVEGYDDAVIVRDIRVESHCEHHMVPIIGVAHVGRGRFLRTSPAMRSCSASSTIRKPGKCPKTLWRIR